jgi:tagatose 1,6-diphosphate aldolase
MGKLRGLQRISGADGIFTMCAMDHRGSLEKRLCPNMPPDNCAQGMTAFMEDLCRILAPYASAVLLDPIYGVAPAISRSLLPRQTGLLVSLEETGYRGSENDRRTVLLKGWGVAKIKRMAADAVKLLVYYRPDLNETARRQRELVNRVAASCQRHDIPCVLEAVSYPVGDEADNPSLFARRKPELVLQTARDLTSLPIDVLKAEFPAELIHTHNEEQAAELCQRLDAASARPWVILSAGADYDTFIRQVEIACRAGASGYLAGRAVWQEIVTMNADARRKFLADTSVKRLQKLADIARWHAVPWYQKLGLDAGKLSNAPRTGTKNINKAKT